MVQLTREWILANQRVGVRVKGDTILVTTTAGGEGGVLTKSVTEVYSVYTRKRFWFSSDMWNALLFII